MLELNECGSGSYGFYNTLRKNMEHVDAVTYCIILTYTALLKIALGLLLDFHCLLMSFGYPNNWHGTNLGLFSMCTNGQDFEYDYMHRSTVNMVY